MKYILHTKHLSLREFNVNDSLFIIELVNSEGWLKYIGDRNIKTEEQAKNHLINGALKGYREHGYGLYLVEITKDKTPIGMCGIMKRENLENPDIGFAFLPEYIGKGYAYEIASATINYAKEKLNISTVCAITVAYNEKSIKLLERIGLNYIKTIKMADDKEELLLYSN